MIDRLHPGRRVALAALLAGTVLGVHALLGPPPPALSAAAQTCDQVIASRFPRVVGFGQYRLERSRGQLSLSRFPNFRYAVFSRANNTALGWARCGHWQDRTGSGYRVTYTSGGLLDLERRLPPCAPLAPGGRSHPADAGDPASASDCGSV